MIQIWINSEYLELRRWIDGDIDTNVSMLHIHNSDGFDIIDRTIIKLIMMG